MSSPTPTKRTDVGRVVGDRPPTLARAGVADTARIVAGVVAPIVAEGVLARRKSMVRRGGRLDTHGRLATILDRLRTTYDADAVRLTFPRRMVLPLRPPAVVAVLHGTPDPFTPASLEKVAALSRFQPSGVLISDPAHRPSRRALNERALETDSEVHSLHRRLTAICDDELSALFESLAGGPLTWDALAVAHWRMVRRLVFGDAARDDEKVTDLLTSLRRDANWGYAFPRRNRVYEEFRAELDRLAAAAPADSLAGAVRSAPSDEPDDDPIGQIPQWLFAFDAVAVAVHRSLGLLAAHPEVLARARTEMPDIATEGPGLVPTLRATVLESLRLWPTTLSILRQATRDVPWTAGTIRKGTTVMVLGEYFQRDDDAFDFAQRFEPEIWIDGRAQEIGGIVPFSDAAGECPGRNLVVLFATTVLTLICRDHDLRDNVLTPRVRSGETDMPKAFNHFDLTIDLTTDTAERR